MLLLIGIPICLLVGGFALPFKVVEKIRLNCCDCVFSYQKCTSKCDWCIRGIVFIIIPLPLILILVVLGFPCCVITFVLLLVPGYICGLVSFINMAIWSCAKNKV